MVSENPSSHHEVFIEKLCSLDLTQGKAELNVKGH